MLVLTRRYGESIRIGDNIEVCVLGINKPGTKVLLGIAAPKNIRVDRDEIHKIRQEEAERGRQDRTEEGTQGSGPGAAGDAPDARGA